jgi:hypothetical protein
MPTCNQTNRKSERGAALILVLFASLLVLACALMLLLTTTISTTNAVSSTDEMQAYYAAEAGLQDALNVLRGNVAPHPDDGTVKMNFKNAINVGTSNNPSSGVAQLSRWLVYNYPTDSPNRVTLSPNYSLTEGIAYAITGISDPDNSREVIYSTAGGFNSNSISTSSSSLSLGGGVSVTYTPQSSTNITTNGNPTLGTLAFSGVKNNSNIDFTSQATTFTLQITEAGPLPIGSSTPISVSVKATFQGSITSTGSIVSLKFPNQTIEVAGIGTLFTMPSQTIQLPVSGTVTTLQTTVASPEPGRLIVKVVGYGPHGASKNLQMMVSRLGIDYDPVATFAIRGAGNDSTGTSTISIGSSANYVYSGLDNTLGQPLPAFLVTTTPDFTNLSNLKSNNLNALTGDSTGFIPNLKQATLPTDVALLPKWLQTTSDPVYGARAFVEQLRKASQQQFYGCGSSTSASCDRYFNTAGGDAAPSEFGTGTTDGLFTFVDGDVSLPNSGGKGLLVVTGTLSMNGSQTFEGLVLVLGGGVLDRSGGGNGTSLGAFVVAKFNGTGDFLAPTFTSSGSGTSTLQLDRNKVKTALRLGGIPVLSVSEY